LEFFAVLAPGVPLSFPGLELEEASLVALGYAAAEEDIKISPISPQLAGALQNSLHKIALHPAFERLIHILVRAVDDVATAFIFVGDISIFD